MLKKIAAVLLLMLALLIVLPALLAKGCNCSNNTPGVKIEPYLVAVWNHRTKELVRMPLGEYLAGVVAAEMPAHFHAEALKAQAIVARTYTAAKIRAGGGKGCDKHPEADVCTDSTHCQAWTTYEEATAKWPLFRQRAYWRKISRAVFETESQVITYQGKLIDAVYHSTCGGSTENSEEVWTNTIPYLRAVECGYCNASPRLTETVEFSAQVVAEKLGVPLETMNIKMIEQTASGRIIKIDTGKEIIQGLEFRKRLGLRSSRVSWLKEKNSYSFTTIGFGHAVGLCQYGADGMARQGFNAQEIINHFYTGIQVSRVQIGE